MVNMRVVFNASIISRSNSVAVSNDDSVGILNYFGNNLTVLNTHIAAVL